MSYNPEAGGTEPTGGNETRNMSGGGSSEVPGGQPTMPTGGYTPPPPPPPGGGYTPPPGGQGGYTPPPAGGGYAPPPPPPGGPGYGYGTPPPPPPPMAGGGGLNPEDFRKVNFQSLIQKYINIFTKPNVAVHEAEIPYANWATTLIGVAAVTVVTFIMNLLSGLLFAGTVNSQLADLQRQLRDQGSNVDMSWLSNMSGAGIGGAFLSLITVPAFFFLGSLVLMLTAKMFGGQGGDFMTQSYLLSLSYTPTRIIAAVVSIIPFIGIIGTILFLYQLYLAGLSLQAAHRMQPGRAQLAAWIPLIVGIVAFCLLFIVCFGVFFAALGGAVNR